MTNTIIFDLDGTLLNTLGDLTASVNHALATAAMPPRTQDEVRAALGNGYRYLISQCVPPATPPATTEAVLATFNRHYEAHCQDTTAPYPGILPLLQALRQRGVRMAIVSNKGQQAVSELVPHFFGNLIGIAVGESATVRRKPCPDSVLEAMRQLGSQPDATLYVGDSEVDHQTALAAGLRSVSCLWGFRTEAFLRSHGATTFISSPDELLAFVGNGE